MVHTQNHLVKHPLPYSRFTSNHARLAAAQAQIMQSK